MLKNLRIKGHIISFLTVFFWGNTFVATKVLLLGGFSPVEILFTRFLLGLIVLLIFSHKILPYLGLKSEFYFAGAGLAGITLYFLFENIALQYTTVSNVGVIVATTPFFTGLFSYIFLKQRLSINFFVGFIVAFLGIFLLSYEHIGVKINLFGDILALISSAVWAIYSVLVFKIDKMGFDSIKTTQRIFFYGLIFMIPALCIFGFDLSTYKFYSLKNIFALIFLGVGASAICFVSWNIALKYIGVVSASVYIYLIPVVAVITSICILNEQLGKHSLVGIFLTIIGLLISETKKGKLNDKL